MTRVVTTLEEAKAVLDYFNGFHDGFIKTLSLISHDVFEARGVQASTTRLDLEIIFAHYNYQQDTRPADQLVKVRFFEVMDLAVGFSGQLHEWSVYEVFISEARRTLEDGREEVCLKAVVVQSRLMENREWTRHEDVSFTFGRAEFEEV